MDIIIPISNRQIADQIITALEGGINYWCRTAAIIMPDGSQISNVQLDKNPDILETATIKILEDDNEKWHTLTKADFQAGLQLMATKFSQHFSDVVNDSGDADTADVFMQLVALKSLIYG